MKTMVRMKKIYKTDPYLEPFKEAIEARHERILAARKKIAGDGSLSEGINNHLYYGLHKEPDGSWVIREWAPNASRLYLEGDFNNWKRTSAYEFKAVGAGNWELRMDGMFLNHGDLVKGFPHIAPAWSRTPRPRCSAHRSGNPRNHIPGRMTGLSGGLIH